MITQEELKRIVEYRDGKLFWKVAKANSIIVGTEAGGVTNHGYRCLMVNGKSFLTHRLIWFYHYGYFPENEVDNINRDRLDNRIENLREASRSCNMRNASIYCNNTSSVVGVSWHKWSRNWQVFIKKGNKKIHLGRFSDFTEAAAHRLAAEQCLSWGDCNMESTASLYMQKYIEGDNL